jgi:hypothetical protein
MEGVVRRHFRPPPLLDLKGGRPHPPAVAASPLPAAVFDEATRRAIGNGLCVACRGAKLLCGKARCPLLVRFRYWSRTKARLDGTELNGSSPPGVFVGRIGYPKVFVGPLVPPVHGATEILDLPEAWVGKPLDAIVAMRSQLVRGMHRVPVTHVDNGGRLVDRTRELALATQATAVEARFTRRPEARLVLDDGVQPFGPSAPMEHLTLDPPRIDPKLDRATSDTDWLARDAVLWLHGEGLPVSKIQRAFSVGAFGVGKRRRFVPTRWSITAVDDTIGKALREETKAYPVIDDVRVYEAVGFDDRFVVLQIPRPWRYELIEAWYPNTLWNPLGRRTVLFGDHEGYEGRTTYARIGGCYYAARLAVAEALCREGRQATTVVLRETHPGYLMPIGVWNVREHVRAALRQPPRRFPALPAALRYVRTRLDIPIARWIRMSAVLKDALYQRTLHDFLHAGSQ